MNSPRDSQLKPDSFTLAVGSKRGTRISSRPDTSGYPITDDFGVTKYFLDKDSDLLHREQGPAVIYPHRQEWWVLGQRHRLSAPAIITENSEEWWLFGQLHRLDGPAVKYNYKASQKYEKEAVKKLSGLETNNGFIWYQNGKRHREKGPAFVQLDGTELWYYNDVLHRENGPALIKPNGQKEWWLFGDWIKTEGPAISYADTGAIG